MMRLNIIIMKFLQNEICEFFWEYLKQKIINLYFI